MLPRTSRILYACLQLFYLRKNRLGQTPADHLSSNAVADDIKRFCDELWRDTLVEHISLQQTGFTSPQRHR